MPLAVVTGLVSYFGLQLRIHCLYSVMSIRVAPPLNSSMTSSAFVTFCGAQTDPPSVYSNMLMDLAIYILCILPCILEAVFRLLKSFFLLTT